MKIMKKGNNNLISLNFSLKKKILKASKIIKKNINIESNNPTKPNSAAN